MSWKDVPLPDRMKDLPRHMGFPVPYVILQDNSGVYHFKINDDVKRERCIVERLCAICGQELGEDMWLVGGPLSAFHPNGAFQDTMLHQECAYYALKVCPYLAARAYNVVDYMTDKKLDKVDLPDGTLFVDPTMIMERPEVFVSVKIRDFTRRIVDVATNYIIPVRPYLEIEYWDKGEMVDASEFEFTGPGARWTIPEKYSREEILGG